MALFKIQMFKEHPFMPGRAFSNSYIVAADTIAAAAAAVTPALTYEKKIFDGNFTITYARVSSLAPNDNVFTTVTLNEPGIRATSGETTPLFNTVRLDVNSTTGRPSRWHYRGLHEGEMANNQVDPGMRALVEAAWGDFVVDLTAAGFAPHQPDGELLADFGTCAIEVKDRKLHRRRKKKAVI